MSDTLFHSRKGFLAIRPPEFKKIEANVKGGIVRIAQRSELIAADLMMSYTLEDMYLSTDGHKILLKGDAGLHPWAAQVYSYNGMEFCLCPEAAIIGILEVPRKT